MPRKISEMLEPVHLEHLSYFGVDYTCFAHPFMAINKFCLYTK